MSQSTRVLAPEGAGAGPFAEETSVDGPEGDGRSRRRRLALLSVWGGFWALYFSISGGFSWHYFVQGSTLLFHGAKAGQPAGGLDLYANYPQLQIGPVTFALAEGLRHLGGGIFMIGWTDLSVGIGHLDDVLALTLVTLAVWALTANIPTLAGLCLGLSVDSKPWALVFLALILTVPKFMRTHVAVWTIGTVLVAWLPFVIADPHMLTAASAFTIPNEPSSSLRALGVADAGTPKWDRMAQIGLGCLLGGIAVWRRRWPAIILLGVGARIVLDPGVYAYYTSGILLGALMWDTLGLRKPWPMWTIITGSALAITPIFLSNATILGQIRLWLVVLFSAAVLITPAYEIGPLARRGLGRRRKVGTRRSPR